MLMMRGHEVIHLGIEGSTVPCSKNIDVMSEKKFRETYGEDYPSNKFYETREDGPYARYMNLWASRTHTAILENMDDDWTNIVACGWGGSAQKAATANLPQFVVESGIGYKHTWTKYRVFESYAWMHMLYGEAKRFDGCGWLDTVIPNAFDPEMFEYREVKNDYLLYLGRLNQDKGVQLAVEIAKAVGRKLVMAGQGDAGQYMKPNGGVLDYRGPVGLEVRKGLLAGANALLCPTFYVEPFGGVAVEAQMSGTPVICTDWGAFPETVVHGVTGFRCKTREQFIWAAKHVDGLKPDNCSAWALQNFSLERVSQMYEEYFQQLLALKGKGWDAENPERVHLDHLTRLYPDSPQRDLSRPASPVLDPATPNASP